jgi:hypothetical protein
VSEDHNTRDKFFVRGNGFRRAGDLSATPYRLGQLELFSDEEEQFMQREVERKLHEPKLPSAGSRERLWVEKLKLFAQDESLAVVLKMSAGRYATALEILLPRQEYIRKKLRVHHAPDEEVDEVEPGGKREGNWLTLPGCYYTRKPVTSKTNKGLFSAATELRAASAKDTEKKWLAEFLLQGEPEQISNFKMECLYLLRGADGNVTRLVRLVNTVGEVSAGPEAGGTDILPAEQFGSAEKFRTWCLSKGNFNWGVGEGAGNLELQMLHSDVSNNAAYKVARLVEYCGWHPLKGLARDNILKGLWLYDECAFSSTGAMILQDDDGVVLHEGEIYVLSRKGREADFAHGRPQMRPHEILDGCVPEPWMKTLALKTVKLDKSEWEPDSLTMPVLSGFFRETCRRFFDTAGGLGGLMAVGSLLGYAAGPEFFEFYGCLPSIFIPGQMGSGKTFFTNWGMGLQGYAPTKGLGLGKGSRVTPVGLCQQLENYSNLALWFDEYRQYEISDEKVSIIRDSYDRQLAGKWTPDGVQRVIRTTPIVSGETDTSDAATRSRYTHLQISASQRRGNHVNWMRDNRQYFYFFWRHLMANRPEFVRIVMEQVANWFNSEDTKNIPERSRVTYALAYASFAAASVLLESHTSQEVSAYRKFIIERASSAAEDVDSDVNVNVFVKDLIVAFKAGEIAPEFFRVVKTTHAWPREGHDDALVNQGMWDEVDLFMDHDSILKALQISMRYAGESVKLKEKDLRDQLSKLGFWIKPQNMRMGKKGSMTTTNVWGFHVDLHPLGLQRNSDEIYQASLAEPDPNDPGPKFKDGDPRKGVLFSIIEGVEKYERSETAAVKEEKK